MCLRPPEIDSFIDNILGYTVLGCDYFFGDPVHVHTEAGFDRSVWVAEKRTMAAEAVPKWLQGVRELYGKRIVIYSILSLAY